MKQIAPAIGTPGPAATVTVGTVTTLAAGAQATVTNRGTSSEAVLEFGIPQGVAGAGGTRTSTVSASVTGAGSQDIAAPYPAGIIRKIHFSRPARVAIYPTAGARASDQTRFDGQPTAAPSVAMITQATATAADSTIAINEAYTTGTLYLRVSDACTLTITTEEV